MLSYDQSPTSFYGSARAAGMASTAIPVSKAYVPNVKPHYRHLFIVTGPAGSGKSTVAKYLADSFMFPYIEGDEFHTRESVKKMSNGIPLTDIDRWDWLIRLRKEAAGKLEAGAGGVVLTCSALKQKYRDVIRLASYNNHNVLVHFIYLRVSPEMLLARVKARRNHYMKDDMVKSQLESLEEPQEEEHDVLSIEGSGSPLEVNKLAYDAAYGVMTKDLEAKA